MAGVMEETLKAVLCAVRLSGVARFAFSGRLAVSLSPLVVPEKMRLVKGAMPTVVAAVAAAHDAAAA